MEVNTQPATERTSLHFNTVGKITKYGSAYDASLSLWKVLYTTGYVPTRFGSTHVIMCGPEDGEPLVLLHAMGFSSTVWYANIEALARTYRVYAVDYIGDLNRSVPDSVPASREECGMWLDDVLDELGVAQCRLAGISYGGFLSLNYAIHAPHRVSKLVLLSPAASFSPLHHAFIYRIILFSALPLRFIVKGFIRWLSPYPLPEQVVDQFGAAFKHGKMALKVPPGVYRDDELKGLPIPVLLLLGECEVISDGHTAYRRALDCCPQLEAEMLPRAGYLLSMEVPEYVNERMLRFLES